MRIVIGTTFVAAALRDRLGALHHERAAHLADGSGRSGFDRVFAGGIIRAREEDAKAAATFYHFAFAADGAGDAGLAARFFFGAFLDELAFGIIGAGDESPEFTFALDELPVLAFGAFFPDLFRRWDLAAVFATRAEAFREFLARHEAAALR